MNTPHDDEDRLRDRFTGPPRDDERAPGCPEPALIWQARSGSLPPNQRRDLIEHTAVCAHCAEAWRTAGDMGAAVPDTPRPDTLRRILLPVVGVAAAVLVTTGLFVLRQRSGPSGGASEEATRAGGEVAIRALTPEGEALRRDDCVLRWTPGPAGTVYSVSVATGDLEVIARGKGLSEARFQVPEDSLRRLPPAATLVWKVEARLPDGSLTTSPAFFVKLE